MIEVTETKNFKGRHVFGKYAVAKGIILERSAFLGSPTQAKYTRLDPDKLLELASELVELSKLLNDNT